MHKKLPILWGNMVEQVIGIADGWKEIHLKTDICRYVSITETFLK